MRQHLFRKRVTRSRFESLLGGQFETVESEPNKRRNGKWETWTGPSRLVPGRPAKFVKRIPGGRTREGRKWRELAKQMRLI